jgi:hypothetical protein
MFGILTQRLNSVHYFNNHVTLGYKNPEQAANGIRALVDVSHSMKERQVELKCVFSALTAITNTKGETSLPTPCGGTALADAVTKVAEGAWPDEKILVITDGDDTTSTTWKFTPSPDSGVNIDRDGDAGAKREAVVKHLEDECGAELFLIGMGKECKEFIKKVAAKSTRTRVAHIPDGATAAEITGLIRATVAAPAREPGKTGVVIQIDTPEAKEMQPDEAQTKLIEEGAAAVAIGGGMTATQFKETLEAIEKALTVGTVDKLKARTAILYFLNQIVEQDKALPGALLGGRQQHIFVDPAYPDKSGWHNYLNGFLSRLQNKVLKMNPKLTEPTSYVMPNDNEYCYKGVNTYSLLDSVSADVVRAVKADTTWCPPESELTMVAQSKSKKRKAEEQLTPN